MIDFTEINTQLREECAKKIFPVRPREPWPEFGSEVEIPKNLRPCFELRWGDSRRDEIETDDEEVLCIVANNPYSNVVFKDLTIVIVEILLADGSPVPALPDGTPSVDITPSHVVFFGDLEPFDLALQPPEAPPIEDPPDLSNSGVRREPLAPINPTGIAREVVLLSRGARSGNYKVRLQYNFSIESTLEEDDEFDLELVLS